MQPITVSIEEAGRLIGIGRNKTYDLIHAGQLETVRIGRRQFVRMSSIRRLVGEEAA